MVNIDVNSKQGNEFLSSTSQLIYTAIRHKGQCGMFALFSSSDITDDIINWSHRNRKLYCSEPEQLSLNEEICERLLKMSKEERLECCKTARKRILIDNYS